MISSGEWITQRGAMESHRSFFCLGLIGHPKNLIPKLMFLNHNLGMVFGSMKDILKFWVR